MQIGYIRVSTNDQNTDLQRNALNCAGCELIFEDKISGTKSARPGLKKLLLIVERTLAGLAAAREQGRIGGRRPKLTKEQHEQIARLIENGYSRKQLAIIYDIGVSTIYRYHPVEKRQTQSEL
ncbi:hypothetical protein DL711_22760 [Escherichia coli]|nr:hypothetical protein [Escherichia coli]